MKPKLYPRICTKSRTFLDQNIFGKKSKSRHHKRMKSKRNGIIKPARFTFKYNSVHDEAVLLIQCLSKFETLGIKQQRTASKICLGSSNNLFQDGTKTSLNTKDKPKSTSKVFGTFYESGMLLSFKHFSIQNIAKGHNKSKITKAVSHRKTVHVKSTVELKYKKSKEASFVGTENNTKLSPLNKLATSPIDSSVNALAAYMENVLFVPQKMSVMAEMMYT